MYIFLEFKSDIMFIHVIYRRPSAVSGALRPTRFTLISQYKTLIDVRLFANSNLQFNPFITSDVLIIADIWDGTNRFLMIYCRRRYMYTATLFLSGLTVARTIYGHYFTAMKTVSCVMLLNVLI